MADLLDEILALEEATKACLPKLADDPVLQKSDFEISTIMISDFEYHSSSGRKYVVLEPCGPLSYYIAEVMRELLAEENIDAWVTFHY
jgi:hypothetical protein